VPEGSLVVNSSQGGGSKDTWVLAARSSTVDPELSGQRLGTPQEESAPELGPELTSAQQQQQQQQ
jgi:hypothetical protein